MANIYMGDLSTWFQDFFWLIIIIGVIFMVLLIFILSRKQQKEIIQTPIEDDQLKAFIKCYGGTENIQQAELDGRRLKCQLYDINSVDIDALKSLGATGMFISGNQIKMVLPYDMKKFVNFIESKKMEEENDRRKI